MLLNERSVGQYRIFFLLASLCLLFLVHPGSADPGDTTTVVTFVEQNHNNGSAGRTHTETFEFPDGSVEYNQIIMTYLISCPPGGCDPWDRLGQLWVVRLIDDTTEEEIEIARIITPYNIVGGGGPGTCEWEFDVTDYMPLLRGEVTLRSFISSWIGNPQGWECTVTFYFIEGELSIKPYRVVNLWNVGYVPYGDPDRPPQDLLPAVQVDFEEIAELATVRIVTTGHGQGNTHNAAEFSRKDHGIWIDFQNYEQELWRSNCNTNPCSPQGGSWQFNRAGWCPGDKVWPWDISDFEFTPGSTMEFFYYLEAYENMCRPTNPECVDGVTCTDCDYNSTGHTEPNYSTTGQLILWSSQTPSAAEPAGHSIPSELHLAQNFPNPFNPTTLIQYSIRTTAAVRLTVYTLTGQEVATLVDGVIAGGRHRAAFDGSGLPSGVYFYSLTANGASMTRKMLLLK